MRFAYPGYRAYLPFFSFFAARFSFSVFSGFFFSLFFWSMPLLMRGSCRGRVGADYNGACL